MFRNVRKVSRLPVFWGLKWREEQKYFSIRFWQTKHQEKKSARIPKMIRNVCILRGVRRAKRIGGVRTVEGTNSSALPPGNLTNRTAQYITLWYPSCV